MILFIIFLPVGFDSQLSNGITVFFQKIQNVQNVKFLFLNLFKQKGRNQFFLLTTFISQDFFLHLHHIKAMVFAITARRADNTY